MKKLLLISTILLVTKTFAQSPAWLWAKRAGGTGSDGATAIATDTAGNVFMAGNFQSTSITFGATTLTNTGGAGGDIFITKYDVNGNVLWAKGPAEPGGYFDAVTSVATDLQGNVYLAGYFGSSTITFDTITLSTGCIFLVKYDGNGNVIWAKSAGHTGSTGPYPPDAANSIALDAAGNIYIAGNFQSTTITFGSGTLMNMGGGDFFLAKYTNNGNVVWARSAGGADFDGVNAVTYGPSGNIYLVGSFNSDTLIMGHDTLVNAGSGSGDMLIAKYDTAGNVIWAKSAGGPNYEAGISVAVDVADNIFATGSFKSHQVVFDTDTLTNAGMDYDDIFLVKYNAAGNVLWAQRAGGINNDDPSAVVIDASGNAYLAGNFQSPSINFGNDTFTIIGLYLVKYNGATGNVLWATCPGAGDATTASINPRGNVYIAGNFSQPTISFGTTTLSNSGITNVFLAKIDTGSISLQVNPLTNTLSVFIFPNPATNNITISNVNEATIEIADMRGQLIKTITTGGSQVFIDISALPAGLYIARIKNQNSMVVKKFEKY